MNKFLNVKTALLFTYLLISFTSSASRIIEEKVNLSVFKQNIDKYISQYSCDYKNLTSLYAITLAALNIEQGNDTKNLITQVLSKESLKFVDSNLLEMNSIKGFENQILCLQKDKAIILRTYIEKKTKWEHAKAWVMVDQYKFTYENKQPKISVANKALQTYWYSISHNLDSVFFANVIYPYETYHNLIVREESN